MIYRIESKCKKCTRVLEEKEVSKEVYWLKNISCSGMTYFKDFLEDGKRVRVIGVHDKTCNDCVDKGWGYGLLDGSKVLSL